MLKVIQWATGGVGRAAIDNVLRHPELELVGCLVYSAEKDGRDVADIVGGSATGVLATTDVDATLGTSADCVMYAPAIPNHEDVQRILRSGKNVVTPVGWVYPNRASAAVRAIEAACREGGVTLHGSGIHPGGITERFPLMVAGLSSAISHVRAEEFSDIRTYNSHIVVHEVMGFGQSPEDAANGPIATMLQAGFKSSVHMVADQLRFRIDPKIRSHEEVAVATDTVESDVLTIEAGTVAGRRFRWQALVDDVPVVTASVNWVMGGAGLGPAWSFGDAGERFEVEITGDPDVRLTFKGLQPDTVAQGLERNPGIVSTANHCVNAIPYVCAAEPGIKTYLDLSLITGRAAPHLAMSSQ